MQVLILGRTLFLGKKKRWSKKTKKHTQLLKDEDSVTCSTIPLWRGGEFKFIVANDNSTLISALSIFPSKEKLSKVPSKQVEG